MVVRRVVAASWLARRRDRCIDAPPAGRIDSKKKACPSGVVSGFDPRCNRGPVI